MRSWAHVFLRPRLLAGVAVAAAAVTAYGAVREARAPEVRRFLYHPAPLADGAYAALGSGAGWRTDVFQPEPGVTIRGLVRAPAAGRPSWILFFTGNGANLLEQSRRALDGIAPDDAHGLGVWALRGFEGGTGEPGAEAFFGDARALHARLVAQGASPGHVHLVGFSLGSHLASRLARELQDAGTPAASLSLLAPFETIEVFRNRWYWRLTRPDRYHTAPLLRGMRTPALIVHGAADETLPVSGAVALREAAGPALRLEVLPGLGHLDVITTPRALALVRDFIRTREAGS